MVVGASPAETQFLFAMLSVPLMLTVTMALVFLVVKADGGQRAMYERLAQELGGTPKGHSLEAPLDGQTLTVRREPAYGHRDKPRTQVAARVDGLLALGDGLGAEVAAAMAEACPVFVAYEPGTVVVSRPDNSHVEARVREVIAWARRIGQLLRDDAELPGRVAAVVLDTDDDVELRSTLFAALSGHVPEAAEEVARTLLSTSDSPELRVLAAAHLGRADVLLGALTDAQIPERHRLAAMAVMPADALPDAIVAAIAEPGAWRLWRAAVAAAAAEPTPQLLRAVAPVVERLDTPVAPGDADGPGQRLLLARELAELLGQAPPEVEGIEALLCRLLTVDDDATRDAAAAALGRVGGVGSVPALQGVPQGLAGPRPAVADAVRAIQARASGDVGAVSLADVDGGQLSLADDAEGKQQAVAQRDRRRATE